MMIKLEWENLWVYDGQWLESYFDSSHPNNIYIYIYIYFYNTGARRDTSTCKETWPPPCRTGKLSIG